MGFLGRSCEFHLSRVSTWVLQVGVLGSRSFLIGRTSVGIEVFILRSCQSVAYWVFNFRINT